MLGLHAAIDQQGVAFVNARTHHAVAFDAKQKSGFLVANQVLVEIDAFLAVIGRRAGKTCGHFPAAHLQAQRLRRNGHGMLGREG